MYVSSTRKNLLLILQSHNTQINIHVSHWLWSRFLLVDSQTHQRIKCLVTVNFLFKCVILELKKNVRSIKPEAFVHLSIRYITWKQLHYRYLEKNVICSYYYNLKLFIVASRVWMSTAIFIALSQVSLVLWDQIL